MTDSPASTVRTAGPSPCSIIVTNDVLADIEKVMSADTLVEYGGVLIGTADPVVGLVIITAAKPLPDAVSAKGTASSTVTFTTETWIAMNRRVIDEHPGQRIVGWYHSHPRSGIYFSAHDLLIQTRYFSQPWQVGYVFDPVQHERGFFGWASKQVVRIPDWSVTTPASGVDTDLPANTPAHGSAAILRHLADRTSATVDVANETEYLTPGMLLDPTSSTALQPSPRVTVSNDVAPSPPSNPDDLDAWMATLEGSMGPPTGPRNDGPVSTLPSEIVAGSAAQRRRRIIAALVALIVTVVVVAVVVARGGNGKAVSPTTTVSRVLTPVTAGSTTQPDPAGSTPATSRTSASTVSSTATTTATTTSGGATTVPTPTTTRPASQTSAVPTTAAAASQLPPTPANVAAPALRVGNGSAACVAGADGFYTPTSECFVPLVNGNLVVFDKGALACADPSGQMIGAAKTFIVGYNDQPLAVIADGALLSSCADLTYAKNVLAAGANTLDRLCGKVNAPIDDTTLRCFAQNTSSGSMLALLKNATTTDLIAVCAAANAAAAPLPVQWSIPGTDSTWKVISVVFDQASQQFLATATKNAKTSTSTITCA
jgi:proteasome lid subunit RPN8/RPN11